MTTPPSRLRPFTFQGHRFELLDDAAARAHDVATFLVTVKRVDDGRTIEIDPAEHDLPVLPGIPPPGELYNPRLFIEEVLRLGFDDRWLALIIDWMNRHRLFMRKDRGEGGDGE